MPTLRIGILGAARIAPMALIQPARETKGAIVTAVAARDHDRASAFARRHSIPVVHDSYEALIEDPDIDVVYNPLPNGLHGRWSIAAMEAGKPVLCEKPLAANAEEAAAMVEASERTGQRLVEAFHYRYHALIARVLDIIAAGDIGTPQRYIGEFVIPIVRGNDIRYDYSLAGGAMMDLGCYPLHLIRTVAAAEPRVVSARAVEAPSNIDRSMEAELAFDDGRTAHLSCSLWSPKVLRLSARIEGSEGTLDIFNPVAPHFYNRLKVTSRGTSRSERARGPSTYTAQLRAFVTALGDGTALPTEGQDSIAQMRAIDAIYQAAGLPLRQPAA